MPNSNLVTVARGLQVRMPAGAKELTWEMFLAGLRESIREKAAQDPGALEWMQREWMQRIGRQLEITSPEEVVDDQDFQEALRTTANPLDFPMKLEPDSEEETGNVEDLLHAIL
jgi:hypothetical protein